jgi:hypothetical protein
MAETTAFLLKLNLGLFDHLNITSKIVAQIGQIGAKKRFDIFA